MKKAMDNPVSQGAKSSSTHHDAGLLDFDTFRENTQLNLVIQQSDLRKICLIMSVVLLVFGLNNFATGYTLLGSMDVLLAAVMLFNTILLRYLQPNNCIGLTTLAAGGAAVIMAIYTNPYGIYWAYLAVIASFLVVSRQTALVFDSIFILLVVAVSAQSLGLDISARLATTLSLTAIFGHIFSHRIEQRTNGLLIQMQELDKANSVKSEFVANMSHEMRTPLTAVLGYSENLLDESDLSTPGREKLEAIVFGARHLSSLIEDVLDISKAEKGHLEVKLEKTELIPLIKNLIRTMEPAAQAKGIELQLTTELPLPISVYTDPLRLQQILMNLIGNAIKFTEAGSVTLSAKFHPADKTIEFCVVDTGIGVPEEFRHVLFDQFSQADSEMNRSHEGTGLGLYISKNLAALLHGKLQYFPQENGSMFQLLLDTGSALNEVVVSGGVINDTQLPPSQPAEMFSGHILIVEDSSTNQLLIGLLLEKLGLTHSQVSNGLEAVARLRIESFDLVLMDLQMPVMSGIEATKAIREFDRDTPIVALSADVLRHHPDSEEMRGFTAFLAKPIDVMKMRELFSRLLPQLTV